MLKQRAENKAGEAPDSVIVSGRSYHRRDFEDPERPGFTRAGRLYTSAELHACGLWNLVAPSGFHFHGHLPLPLASDPAHVSVSEAPASLLRAVEQTQAALDAHRGKIHECQDRIHAADVAAQLAIKRQDKRSYNAALAAGIAAEEQLRALLMEEPPFVKRVADAERAVKFWQDDERMYRIGVAERPEPSAGIF